MASVSSPQAEQLSVAVIGLGAIGGVAAGCLAAAGRYDLVACVRQPIERLTLDAPDGTVTLPLHALTDPAQANPVDWVLLCTKTHATASTAPWLKALCVPSTRVAVLQNGVDHVARVAPFAGAATVLPVIVYYNGERLGADHVKLRRGADPDVIVADDDAGRAFTQLFEGTPLRVKLGKDFATLAWRKLLLNAVASPVTALTLQRQAVLRRPDIKELCLAVLEEAIAVGRAEGARLADDEAARTLATLFTFAGELGTSMYFD
ncbi:MAG TPA: 2-dehydropantoate 2-reductase N-terminal domain-containing protein, partial [Xanthobacteraceae bacterium]|nr:2-dehydropantoate 2-reductase N-terminal domain-containing protein [Xanthobacteraceae bacterium]